MKFFKIREVIEMTNIYIYILYIYCYQLIILDIVII